MTETLSAGDTAWVLGSTGLVMLMVPGLAFFYGGLVRGKATLNTMMMSAAALALVSVQWVVCGYSLAFGPGSPVFGSFAWAGFRGVGLTPNPAYAATIPHLAFAAFQVMFAGITVALISGAIVERMRFRAYLVFVVLWTTGSGATAAGSTRWARSTSPVAPSCTSVPARRRSWRRSCSDRVGISGRRPTSRTTCRSRYSAPVSCGSDGLASTRGAR
jgi:hypothetical protein